MEQEIKKPKMKLGEWVSLGENYPYVDAVVCAVYENDPLGNDLEVVYLDGYNAISDGVVWDKNYWRFKKSGPSGAYADNSTRLSRFVQILKAGRK